jgi:hypothetical protein
MSAVDPTGAERAFATAVVLVKREVFDALEACANAERALLRCGRASEAAAIAALFEVLEDRVLSPVQPDRPGYASGPAGSNSSDREFTQ